MRESVFKNYIKTRFDILKLNIINTYQIETAYIGENWGNILSTLFYTVTYIMFVNIIYANVKTFAGYERDGILFLTLIGQISFYIVWGLGITNAKNMIRDVNSGSLDLLLTKPIPSLFYISTRTLSLVSIFRDGFATLLILILSINWNALSFAPMHVFWGIIIFLAGQIAFNAFQFLFALPVFWFGEADQILGVSYTFMGMVLSTIVPVLIGTHVATSVMLGKSDGPIYAAIAISVAILFTSIKAILWKVALRNYSSASS
jgi:ABC-2 type transport system permease protein